MRAEADDGTAVADIGAPHDIIGLKALADLERHLRGVGPRPVRVDKPPPRLSRVGGSATVLGTVLLPFSVCGEAGVVEDTVIKEPVPCLLSVGRLGFLGGETISSTTPSGSLS